MRETSDQADSRIGPAARSTAWLTAHGRQPWTAVLGLLSGCTCVWADLDGWHAEPAPPAPPLATHLWAWDADRLLRVRIDSNEGIAAELHLTESDQGEPVTITEREAASWPSGEGRVSVAQEWRNRALRVYQVDGLMPLEFTRLGPSDPQEQDATPPARAAQDR